MQSMTRVRPPYAMPPMQASPTDYQRRIQGTFCQRIRRLALAFLRARACRFLRFTHNSNVKKSEGNCKFL